MDSKINEWTKLWNQQESNDNFDIDLLIKQVTKLDRITTFQKLTFLFATIFAIFSMFTHLSENIYNSIAIALIVLGSFFVLVPLFYNKPDFNINNTNQFIKNQLTYLRNKLLIPKVYLFFFIVLFILALNIGFWGASYKLDISYRILFHFLTIIIFVILLRARKLGIKNYEKNISPLIEKLELIKNQE